MINYIKGILSEIEDSFIVVESAGVGFGIFVPSTVISELPPKGSEVKVYTCYSVKEDSQSLYGFLYKEDREMFRELLGVSGIGPKGALSILSLLKPDDLRMAIITGDSKAISQAQGVGQRTAQRVIVDLKDKMGGSDFMGISKAAGSGYAPSHPIGKAGAMEEAMEGLSSLGYSRMEAGRILSRLEISESMTTEEILKAALKSIRI